VYRVSKQGDRIKCPLLISLDGDSGSVYDGKTDEAMEEWLLAHKN